MLKELSVNIPLVEALKQISSYAMFLKDLVMKKRTIIFEPIDNVHHCSEISSHTLVENKKDPSAFLILCTIKSSNFTRALCDLSARINLMKLVVIINWGWGCLSQPL